MHTNPKKYLYAFKYHIKLHQFQTILQQFSKTRHDLQKKVTYFVVHLAHFLKLSQVHDNVFHVSFAYKF